MTETKHKSVITEVVANDLCIGCGTCAAVCPRHSLSVAFNQYGEYTARMEADACPHGCRLCLSVCPFFETQANEDVLGEDLFGGDADIQHTPETGYYLDAFVGHTNVAGRRRRSASGGLATWLLETLLRENRVDYVICVSATADSDKRFQFTVCRTAEEVRAGAGSCYYPVEMSGILQHIAAHEGRYAVIALPCFCKAIRLAMKRLGVLQQRIAYVLGLVCGQAKSAFFAEYACALGGGDPHRLNRVEFRVKDPDRPASDYGLKFVSGAADSKQQEGIVFQTQGVSQAWGRRYFTPTACGFCDDVFAEAADACFMDAWLPRYARDWQGHSILLVRQRQILELVRACAKDRSVTCRPLPIREVIASQRSGLRSKRGDIRHRIRIARRARRVVPAKRLAKCTVRLCLVRKRLVQVQSLVSQQSRRQWVESAKDLSRFVEAMAPCEKRLRRLQFLWKIGRVPGAVLRRLRNRLRDRRPPA